MKTFFVEQSKNVNIIRLNSILQKDNKIIINRNLSKINLKKKIKLVNKIKKILEKENCKQIALEKVLKDDVDFINLLYSSNINICSPKWILIKHTREIIEKALKGEKKEETEINICVNEVNSIVEKYIYEFAKEFKRLNIITNHIGKFKKIEENLYKEYGILITIANNKRKSLSKAKLILNVDFPKEIINQFTIYDNATIITWEDDTKISKKRFNGRIISDYEIHFDKNSDVSKFVSEHNLEGYDLRDISQAICK